MLIKLAGLLLASSFVLSAFLTAVVKSLATRVGFVAHPAADRYHRRIVPLGGGIAIFATLMFFMLAATLAIRFPISSINDMAKAANIVPSDFIGKTGQLVAILLSIAALFALGLWDDKKRLDPFFKLAIQFAVAIFAAAFGEVRVELFIENKIIASVLSAFWIVLIVNAFNFLDNMDGVSAGIAAIASGLLFFAAASSSQIFVGGLALVFIGTLLGFLVFNFPPAKVFMGDAGSLVVGFFVALLTLRTTYYHEGFPQSGVQAHSGHWYAVFMPLIVMAVPLYDFISVTVLRISQGKSPFIGDTQHFSHRLKRRGLSDTQTALTLYLATLCTGLGATFLYQVNLAGAILIFVQMISVLAIIAVFETTAGND
ncbi:MAG: undecaprenyl/decaprenyl-phosphate alpha-N-acetylglucosaminyl 1-phosphate transferase [Sedimentisphaerales bacterium]|jgi:UDP-GlcNAc:undecaprenyl-phosphate GlcNAc-1-phosphate transferase|nr:undecaprenyl/decaprenyl-phosphate alpha-N-acetylglucosaminyl 1-phosphate transferase [Sedimentisphaerales bacterium]